MAPQRALQTELRTVRLTGHPKEQPTEPQTGQHLELQMALPTGLPMEPQTGQHLELQMALQTERRTVRQMELLKG
jgi:hypothetical protein